MDLFFEFGLEKNKQNKQTNKRKKKKKHTTSVSKEKRKTVQIKHNITHLHCIYEIYICFKVPISSWRFSNFSSEKPAKHESISCQGNGKFSS